MFCSKCGEAIPDKSVICPKCGVSLNNGINKEYAVVYASQKEVDENNRSVTTSIPKEKFYIWSIFAIVSFVFLALNYFKISVSLYFAGSSDTSYSGYGLLDCLQGSVSISGYMVILLMITNIAVLITGIVGVKENILKASVLKIIMMIESILYLLATIVPYFNIKKVLGEFNSKYSTTSIGAGCYLNIALALAAAIYFFVSIYKELKDK